MTPNELRALADALTWVQYTADWQACHSAADYLRACADARPVAPAVPAGWKLVPVEPTPEMLHAEVHGSDWNGRSGDERARAVWAAVLAAAPAAPHHAMLDSHRRLVEQAIQSAEHPSGMSTHDGKARIDASILRRMLAIIDSLSAAPQAEPKREPLSDERIDAALQTEPVLITRLMIGSMTVGEFKAALRRVARIIEHAHGIGGSDAQAEPKRKPLTLEQIDSLIERLFYHLRYEPNRVLWEHAVSIVRAVEHAHEIGGSDAE